MVTLKNLVHRLKSSLLLNDYRSLKRAPSKRLFSALAFTRCVGQFLWILKVRATLKDSIIYPERERVKVMLHETIRNDDFSTTQGWNIVAAMFWMLVTLFQHCNAVLSQNHCCESSRVTSPCESGYWKRKRLFSFVEKIPKSKKPIKTAKFTQEIKTNWFDNSMCILSIGAHWPGCFANPQQARP